MSVNEPKAEEAQGVSLEDGKLAIEILKKTLEYRPLVRPAVVGQDYLSLSTQARFAETMKPTVALTYADEGKSIPTSSFGS